MSQIERQQSATAPTPCGSPRREGGRGYVLADMLCQFRVRACADRTRATDPLHTYFE
jgi:hypothetical protein